MIRKQILLFLLQMLFVVSLPAQQRPKIGLVLSGGAAKGIAHIGVLEVLEEAGVPIDYIAGTSMGGIVGGLYAMGLSADSLESIVESLDWEVILSDNISRTQLSINKKKEDDRFVLNFPLGKRGVQLPSGVIRGQHIETLLSTLTFPAYRINDFDQLPIPFRCVSLNVDRGRDTIFGSGNLATALRATMAIPSLFEPVVIDGDRLVDGGVSDNFPVDVVRKMGADIVIGVDVGFVRKDSAEKDDFFGLLEDALLFYSLRNNKRNREMVDIYIEPDLKDLGVTSFRASDSLITYGRNAALAIFPRLKHLADSIRSLQPVTPNPPLQEPDSLLVKDIDLEGLINIKEKAIRKQLSFHPGEWVTPHNIEQTTRTFYNTGLFNEVNFMAVPSGDGIIVKYLFREKEEGLLRFGFYYDNNFKTSVFLNTTLNNLILKNTRFSASAGLGKNPTIDIDYYLDKGPILAPGIHASGGLMEAWNYGSDRNRITSTYYFVGTTEGYLQSSFSNLVQVRMGWVFNHTTLQPGVGPLDLGSQSDNHFGFFGQLYLDTRDRAYFPGKGHLLWIRGEYFLNGNLPSFQYIHGKYNTVARISKKLTLETGFMAGIAIGDTIPFPFQFRLGGTTETTFIGNFPFPGYRFLEIATPALVMADLTASVEVFPDIMAMVFLKGGFRGPDLNTVLTGQQSMSGYGIGLGFNGPFGPIKLSISKSGEYRQVYTYIQAGYWF